MNKMTKAMSVFVMALMGACLFPAQKIGAHCQLPCGIYDDHARVQSMLEDVETIERAVNMITALAGKSDSQSRNQTIRWVMNKETHAQRIIDTISDYFLTQRVKPAQKDYAERLARHHAVIVAAMKAKQNVDMKYVNALKKDIERLLPYYPGQAPKKHEH